MSLTTRVGLLAGATALTLTGVSYGAPATGNDDMAQRLAAAEAKIAQLEASNNQNWLTEQRASEIKGLVQDVLADADTRASLLQSGATSGYDNGFIISSTDGNWLLRFNFLMQQRFVYNHIDVPDSEGSESVFSDEDRYGFENTRSTLMLSGHIINPNWFYRLDVNFGSNSTDNYNFVNTDTWDPWASNFGRMNTLNAYLGYDYGNGWRVKVGTMKVPFMREELVESQYQLLVERSNVNYIFTPGYADGLAVEWNGDRFRVVGMFSDGAQTGQTLWSNGPDSDFSSLPGAVVYPHLHGGHAEYALTGRAEFLVNGTWDQFKDFTSPQGGEMGILVGGAVHWQNSEFGVGTPSNVENLMLTGDVSVEFGGANLYGAVVWTDNDFESGPSWNPWGFIIQGGFYLDPTWEIFARYEWTDYDLSGVDDLSLITFGVNKYFAGHNAKWTTDFGYGINSVNSPARITGWRHDWDDSSDGQWVVRSQIQLYF